MGINRGVFLKSELNLPTPTMEFLQPNSPLGDYNSIMQDMTSVLLSSNNMSPNSISGSGNAKSFNSGFQAMIEHADNFEAIERDKPLMMDAEQDAWPKIAAIHNWQFDNDLLNQDARALGKFSDDFKIEIQFADMKPIESDQERINDVDKLMSLNLITRRDALRKLNPLLQDDQIEQKLLELKEEEAERMNKVNQLFEPKEEPEVEEEDGEES